MTKSPDSSRSAKLARHIASATSRPLPDAVIEKTKHHILDTFAAILSGSEMEPGIQAIKYAKRQGGRKEAGVLGSSVRTNAVQAALANGMSAHADETDDSHPFSLTHPGCSAVPAALAMAERQRASGLQFLKAVAVGYDGCARTGLALGGEKFLNSGKDSHSFAGTIGAVAAAAALCGMDEGQTAVAVSYATQQAGGLRTLFRDREHTEKAFVFAGMPALAGTQAAAMVHSGMTGVADPLDTDVNFFTGHGAVGDADKAFNNLGRPFEIMRTNIKRWSVGSPAQAVLDALELLIAKYGVGPDDVKSVTIHLSPRATRVVDGREMPDVNVQYLAAVMLTDGTVSFTASHDHARMGDPGIGALRRRIKLVPDDRLGRRSELRQAIVEITLRSGRALRQRVNAVRGTTANPMTLAEVEAKALELMAPVIGRGSAKKVISGVRRIEKARSLEALVALMQGK
jgi:2-methylcitrate dehydratase PrpD